MARKKSVKAEIPWALHIAIIKLQGNLESSYEEAARARPLEGLSFGNKLKWYNNMLKQIISR
jgi:hypothetical protein